MIELRWVYDYCILDFAYTLRQVRETYAVAAAVDTKVGRHGDGAAEVEDGVEGIKTNNEERVDHERLLDACRNEVEQRQHAED